MARLCFLTNLTIVLLCILKQFLRGVPHLCKRMRRKAATSVSVSDPLVNQYAEPDFYRMEQMTENPMKTRIEKLQLNQSDEETSVPLKSNETMGFEGLIQNPDTIASHDEVDISSVQHMLRLIEEYDLC
jgi:hypothetical protein